uniref:ATP-grasp domain-containing protein n=1 Tax=Haptolina ericina TaxID=156174 RepID=A0A7S3BPE7_9EUKA|mmetsp:Transcript_62960/g.140185  ORF Transcript_62960/g.140185 Transcript_62960/m.140185 type:complete len:333 (+) Transcript_62960:54-1052(+)
MWFFSSSPPAADDASLPPAVLLVIQADAYDWVNIMKGARLHNGRALRVIQTSWEDIHVHCDTYSSASLCIEVRKTYPPVSEKARPMTVQPDFVLIRNEVRTPGFDARSRLSGLLFADCPSVNSLESIQLFCDRAHVMGQLHRLHRQLGDAFPVVPQHFASSHRSLMYGYTFPAVVKVGSAHAGVGKMQIRDHHQMSDFRSVLAMMPHEHCFVEPFIVGVSDLRIQKIGSNYRAFRRSDVSGEWKTNTGTAIMEELDCEPRWRAWADAAAGIFGGLEILTVDAIIEEGSGKELIIEVNGTSSGLFPDCAAADNQHIAELVLERMNELPSTLNL